MNGVAFDFTDFQIELRVLDERLYEWGLPCFQSEAAAGIDLRACSNVPITLHPGDPATLIQTGFSMFIGTPYVAALILPRSGLGHRKGLVIGNTVGVVDPDYTGSVMMSAWNRNAPGLNTIIIQPGERIAQMMFVPIVRPRFKLVEKFSQWTARGENGFGSTGC